MRTGSAHVRGLYTVPAASGTQFSDGCDAIWSLGLRTVKLYCTAAYLTDYPGQATWSAVPTNLTELAQTTQFQTQLSRGWHTVMLTCFTFANGTTNWWRADPSNAKLVAEYNEVKALAIHLLTTYSGSGRRFILQNWEGDWAFMDSFDPTTPVPRKMVDYYAAFLNARQRAVADARRETTYSGVSVEHAIETNRVLDAKRFPNRRRILTDLARLVKPDLVSYSAYDSTIVDQGGWNANQAAWVAATTPAYRFALKLIRAAFPDTPLYLGEFGFPENEADFDFAPPRDVAAMIDLIYTLSLGVLDYFTYWQVFDNEASFLYTYRGYWLIRPDGSISVAGATMSGL